MPNYPASAPFDEFDEFGGGIRGEQKTGVSRSKRLTASASRIREVTTVDYQTLGIENHDGVTTVTVTRPEARNALSSRTLFELRHFLHSDVTGPLIITGAPGPAFIAGADIHEM